MAKEKTCPGCSRHCPLSAPRCKYGRAYSEKAAQKQQAQPVPAPRYKWEKYVASGGVMWRLLRLSCRMKKALRAGTVTEARLLSALSPQQQTQLQALLDRLYEPLENLPE